MRAVLAALCLALSAAAPARAQDAGTDAAADATVQVDPEAQRTAIARALFEEGLELAERGQWARAADRFRRAAAVRRSAPIEFNLAQSLARLGRIVEATELLHDIEDDPRAEASVRAAARELRARLDGELARLTIEVAEMPASAHVALGDVSLPAEVVGVAMPVDPGTHRVRLMEGETELDARTVEVGRGEAARVTLGTDGAAGGGGSLFTEPWFWAAAGLVVAAGVVATLLIVTADDDPGATVDTLIRF